MARQYKLARRMKKIALTAAAKELGVSQPTLSAWESERKNPSIDALCRMAGYYGVTTDFLLGINDKAERESDAYLPIPVKTLPSLHGQPAWTEKHGWVLIDGIEKCLITVEDGLQPFADTGEVFMMPPPFAVGYQNLQEPLTIGEVKAKSKTWLEPLDGDSHTRTELRGWYHVSERFVQNEYGNRFYLDTYGVKWLAFDSELA